MSSTRNQHAIETMATSNIDSQRHMFPFFSLPRELRDAIYQDAALLNERNTVDYSSQEGGYLLVNAADEPLPIHNNLTFVDDEGLEIQTFTRKLNLMTVSKQFREEYMDATRVACSKLVITDKFGCGDANDMTIPRWAKNCTNIKLNVKAICKPDISFCAEFAASAMKQLPRVEEIHIRVNCTALSSHRSAIQEELNKSVSSIEGLRSLEVYDVDEPVGWVDDIPIFTFEENETPMLRWSSETKKLEIVGEEQE